VSTTNQAIHSTCSFFFLFLLRVILVKRYPITHINFNEHHTRLTTVRARTQHNLVSEFPLVLIHIHA